MGEGKSNRLVILDRDGVLNAVVVDPEQGTIDSPMVPAQVRILPGVPEALKRLTEAGFHLFIASNQPAAAKGKTTRANLEATHQTIVEQVSLPGVRIEGSLICFHRSEVGCDCRKPSPKMLKQALAQVPGADPATSWMVGDGVTDVQAGRAAGLNTAFLGPLKCDICKTLKELGAEPDVRVESLSDFVDHLLERR
ncbi:MAG TPA: HAD-IIIA family hydrolase [Bdellovibrionota bacterium]|nr:HAD-IIIA family hydrolase [Bdellovibrionota bacterium]